MKKITIAGSVLTDIVKMIDVYPQKGNLTNITSIRQSVGGCVPNTGIDLKRLAPEISVRGVGRIGNDANGEYVRGMLEKNGLEARFIVDDVRPTSFSDVMTQKNGERTFFHARGANTVFSADDIIESDMDCDLFHLGYLLLLDAMDAEDKEYGTVAARLLHDVKARGVKTAIDTVSCEGSQFRRVVGAALPYVDYAVMNEVEASAVTGVELRKGDKLIIENLKDACAGLIKLGVSEKAVIHCPELGCGMDKNGKFTVVPSLQLPQGYIIGAVGAGDAFCSGMLYSFLTDLSMEEGLQIASLAAACNLSSDDSIGGARSLKETLELENKFTRKKI